LGDGKAGSGVAMRACANDDQWNDVYRLAIHVHDCGGGGSLDAELQQTRVSLLLAPSLIWEGLNLWMHC